MGRDHHRGAWHRSSDLSVVAHSQVMGPQTMESSLSFWSTGSSNNRPERVQVPDLVLLHQSLPIPRTRPERVQVPDLVLLLSVIGSGPPTSISSSTSISSLSSPSMLSLDIFTPNFLYSLSVEHLYFLWQNHQPGLLGYRCSRPPSISCWLAELPPRFPTHFATRRTAREGEIPLADVEAVARGVGGSGSVTGGCLQIDHQ